MKIVTPQSLPRERLGTDLRSGSVHEIWRDPDDEVDPRWSLSLVDVKRNVKSLHRPEGTVDHWLGISGPQLRLVDGTRQEKVRADHQIVVESTTPLLLLRSSIGRAKSTRLLRVTRKSEMQPIILGRVFVSDPIEFDPDVRAIYLISGRLRLADTELAEGEAAIFDETVPPVMHSDGAFVATMAIPCVEVPQGS
ncbi:hypothetical protein [Pseudoclavibacter helvolus]|uniref:hypothetical protein n=1 Tax=Pseudoclavibacter helvolus TaxID=255205 RepID=UPI0037365B28